MTKKILIIISVTCLLMLGCKSGGNREAFLEQQSAVANEIVRIVDAKPTAEGVKQAQDYLNSQKASLKSKFDAGKKESNNAENQERFLKVVTYNMEQVGKLSKKYPNLKADLDNLSGEFSEFLLK